VAHNFCPGYTGAFATLAKNYPGTAAYPQASFRTEWGPIFHRGRLNGSARVLCVGQDPAAHENLVRRVLVGEAGQRVQGFLAKLGLTTSYVVINAFVYSAYDQTTAGPLVTSAAIAAYRNQWFDKIVAKGHITAVVTFGGLAEQAYHQWRQTAKGTAFGVNSVNVMHPTADAHPPTTTAGLLANWNTGLTTLQGKATPDHATPLVPYGTAFAPADLVAIPEADLPAGLPDWMRALDPFAWRPDPPPQPPLNAADTARYKRQHLLVGMPPGATP
jgi:uracil-DNA glycosylase